MPGDDAVFARICPLFSRTAHTGWYAGVDEPDEYDEPELVRVVLLDELERLLDEELDERELLPLLDER